MTPSPPHPFDRNLHRQRLDRAAADFAAHAFLFEEVADRIADRLEDIRRPFARALVIGDRAGTLTRALIRRAGSESVYTQDPSPAFARRSRQPALVAEENALPFARQSLDLAAAVLSLHWVNDLPGALVQIRRALKPDGLFIAAIAGGRTLVELRTCLMDAELEIRNGAEPRVLPFTDVRGGGDLLARAGFALPVADADVLTVTYATPAALMRDLRGMGETAALASARHGLRRDTLEKAMRLYTERHSEPDGRVRASFEIIHLAGWAPAESQPHPLPPGSATRSLADALREAAVRDDAGHEDTPTNASPSGG